MLSGSRTVLTDKPLIGLVAQGVPLAKFVPWRAEVCTSTEAVQGSIESVQCFDGVSYTWPIVADGFVQLTLSVLVKHLVKLLKQTKNRPRREWVRWGSLGVEQRWRKARKEVRTRQTTAKGD